MSHIHVYRDLKCIHCGKTAILPEVNWKKHTTAFSSSGLFRVDNSYYWLTPEIDRTDHWFWGPFYKVAEFVRGVFKIEA